MVTQAKARQVVHSALKLVIGTDGATYDVINTLTNENMRPYLYQMLGMELEDCEAEVCPNEDIQYESNWAERWVTPWEASRE